MERSIRQTEVCSVAVVPCHGFRFHFLSVSTDSATFSRDPESCRRFISEFPAINVPLGADSGHFLFVRVRDVSCEIPSTVVDAIGFAVSKDHSLWF